MQLHLPDAAIVLCIGPSNSGKSTFLQQLIASNIIKPSEIVSSDDYRITVADIDFIDFQGTTKQEADLLYEQYSAISTEAFQLMEQVVTARAKLNRLTFVDATHLNAREREKYFAIAKRQHVPIYGIIFDAPLEQLLARDNMRENPRGAARIKQQARKLKDEKRFLKKEAFAKLYTLNPDDAYSIVREPSSLAIELGTGIDVIGDIHGCYDEMMALIEKLGYREDNGLYIHPEGRKLISVGDIMSRGPKSLATMQFWLKQIEAGLSFMTDSNHGWKIARWLEGRAVQLSHGDELVEQEIQQFEIIHGIEETKALKERLAKMLLRAPSHYLIKENGIGKAVITHAGIRDRYIGKNSSRIRDFCRYGDVVGTEANGRPIRADWYADHQTSELIIWGHEPKLKPLKMNNTVNIDQGVVFGGQLTAFRYPESTFEAVTAYENYAGEQQNPLLEAAAKHFDPPNIHAFIDGFEVATTHGGTVWVGNGYAKAAIDTVSHYTVPLEQLIYIPPTMSPTPQTSQLDDYLEHPAEAFAYYKKHGFTELIAEKKHMGSRAVLLLFKNKQIAKEWIDTETLGVITTRSGRAFFDTAAHETIVQKLHTELAAKNYFERMETDFVLLDAEILPWNLKAQSLIDEQYAHVAEHALMDRQKLATKLQTTLVDVAEWQQQYKELLRNAVRFDAVYQNYCWSVDDLSAIQIAPFHILAHSTETCFHKPHTWHMEMNHWLAQHSDIFITTEYQVIENEQDEQKAIAWWEEMTAVGHEGIVIKPLTFIPKSKDKLIQPAIKVRGREYLRIIYGMDYTDPKQLAQLKKRNPSKKMKHALQEFALGLEGIERFVQKENIARIHECVLATLALESDAVDPRL
ncbi:polynucleotide kinase-phosphatase [Metasolibacillus sp.]|uniref:polynucleotide kinase-phosphatase n=1 Tax=Metasolibacillus sp. TaxID=2703680 RepID=UPI0025DBB3F4|nr:polynucleotide kinase-phosphatase [Metasolibacillus sp.]MCT6923782.1 polynucleotide kinase-phosphatase [Metasolibacillus sp.]MCT6939985.1 polynucleotide kinase-phosphatase [Metasolibacillus sp.]